jgi:hypothetical protein
LIATDGENQPHATCTYLGAGMIVTEHYDEPDLSLDLTGGDHGLGGLDRFGRVADQLWQQYGETTETLDEYLCPCQLAGLDFLGSLGRRLSRGTGWCSFSHRATAA